MSKHFTDIGKDSKDLLTQDFPADGALKVVTQSKIPNGLTLKATLNRHFKKEKSGPKELISAVIEPKFEWKAQNVEFTGKLATTNDFNVGFSVKDLACRDSKIEVTSSQSDKDGNIAQIIGSYKVEHVATKIGVAYPIGLVGPKKRKKTYQTQRRTCYSIPPSCLLRC